MVYTFLPNKESATYRKFFKMLLDYVPTPQSLNCDFEKSIHLAAYQAFSDVEINGCFFHLCQNWLKRIGLLGLNKLFLSNKEFRYSFKMCQSLAYLPVQDVIKGFEEIQEISNSNMKTFFQYLEKNYIGRYNNALPHIRKKARFPIVTWNVHQRVLDKKPTTNNPVECRHSSTTVRMNYFLA